MIFRCYFRERFISLAFRKSKKGCNILKIMVQGFCSLKIEIARFPIEFRHKLNPMYSLDQLLDFEGMFCASLQSGLLYV